MRSAFWRNGSTTDGCWWLVEDDGVGWNGAGTVQGSGLGTKVLTAMARNLDAELAYGNKAAGTRVEITFAAT